MTTDRRAAAAAAPGTMLDMNRLLDVETLVPTTPLDPGALRAVLARAQDGRLAGGWTKPLGNAKLAS